MAVSSGPRKVTIADVARRAGVSKTTVSHVLSGNRPVAGGTRQRVERAVRDLGYRPDGLARGLRIRRSHTVALILPDMTNPFYPVLARGLEDELAGLGYRTFVCNTDAEPSREAEYVLDVFDRRVDGIVLVSFHLGAQDLAAVLDAGMPVVSVGADVIDDPRVDVVRADDERGAFEATSHLVARGHRSIAMIEGAKGTGLLRNLGYRRALEASGLRFDSSITVSGAWTRSGGAKAMLELLWVDLAPTAVFCANDVMAIGAMDVASDSGLTVGRDVAIVGYDDIEAAALVRPGLTTMMNPAYDTGRVAGELLAERMTGAHTGGRRTVVLPCRLIERDSS
jgi:LacI family transcriptional regulator